MKPHEMVTYKFWIVFVAMTLTKKVSAASNKNNYEILRTHFTQISNGINYHDGHSFYQAIENNIHSFSQSRNLNFKITAYALDEYYLSTSSDRREATELPQITELKEELKGLQMAAPSTEDMTKLEELVNRGDVTVAVQGSNLKILNNLLNYLLVTSLQGNYPYKFGELSAIMHFLKSMDDKHNVMIHIKYYALTEQEHYGSYALKNIIQIMSRGTEVEELLTQESDLCHAIRWTPKFPQFHEPDSEFELDIFCMYHYFDNMVGLDGDRSDLESKMDELEENLRERTDQVQPLLIKKTAVRVKKILSANELNAQDVEVIGQFFNSLILAELNGMQPLTNNELLPILQQLDGKNHGHNLISIKYRVLLQLPAYECYEVLFYVKSIWKTNTDSDSLDMESRFFALLRFNQHFNMLDLDSLMDIGIMLDYYHIHGGDAADQYLEEQPDLIRETILAHTKPTSAQLTAAAKKVMTIKTSNLKKSHQLLPNAINIISKFYNAVYLAELKGGDPIGKPNVLLAIQKLDDGAPLYGIIRIKSAVIKDTNGYIERAESS